MQKLQDSVFSVLKSTSLSPAVFDYLQPTEDNAAQAPLGGILKDTNQGWLALGPKFCVIDLRSGLKIAQWIFEGCASVTNVVELPTPLTKNSKQLIISLETNEETGIICIFHINGSRLLRCIQTEVVVTKLAVCDNLLDGPFSCFDGILIAGCTAGEIVLIDLNRSALIRALQSITQAYDESGDTNKLLDLTFLSRKAISQIEELREQAIENNEHLALLLNESSVSDTQFLLHNPDGSIRMKAKRDHIRVSTLEYIPQLGSVAVGYNFGAFQIWNLMNLSLEFTSQVNVECQPVTHFGFQEPCDDPRAFCYLWVIYSATGRMTDEEFPLAVMYSLTYQAKRMLSDTEYLYQEFLTSNIRFQLELSSTELQRQLVGGRCVSCHTYSHNSRQGDDGEDNVLNLCQIVWECWGDNRETNTDYYMILFDLDQWYNDQMPATQSLQSNRFMCVSKWDRFGVSGLSLDVCLCVSSLLPYCHSSPRDQHTAPTSLQYNCISLKTSEVVTVRTVGIQRQIIACMVEVGPSILLDPGLLHSACLKAGLTPLYETSHSIYSRDEQRRFLLSVALEARLTTFLKRAAHAWASGSHAAVGCTLTFMVDWCWQRAIDLKQNAKDLTATLFTSSSLPDRNLIRCLEQCVRQLTQLTSLLDDILTRCCNLVVPDALSEYEEKHKCVSAVWLYVQVVQWFLSVGLLPERQDRLAYPATELHHHYAKRRIKLHRLHDSSAALPDHVAASTSCPLLYIDQLIEHHFHGDRLQEMWRKGGSESNGLYPPPTLYSLLRLYLLPDIAHEHKHALVLYLLVDYSMIYDDIRYEPVIRKLMQFPTMFGLSNTAIKATQAFWHLDHRDFDFALDQLQCLTGNNLTDWQHSVVLSALLAQNKTQRALQYLHVRKPPPIQRDTSFEGKNCGAMDRDKLDDWQTCCNLYLARGLIFQALDVIRMCVKNAQSMEAKTEILEYFYRGCRNSGLLAKLLDVSLTSFEEEQLIKYLDNCNNPHTSDILVMYFIKQARYLEAQQYNNKLRQPRSRQKEPSGSLDSLQSNATDTGVTRDALVDAVCANLPPIMAKVFNSVQDFECETRVINTKPLSVYVQANSPNKMFTYRSSFIHNTIENASELWVNRPKMRRGLKRAFNIESTPFLCTPKLSRNTSNYNQTDQPMDAEAYTPPKRARLDPNASGRTLIIPSASKMSDKLSKQIQELLDMPEVLSPPQWKLPGGGGERSGGATPHSILKTRKSDASAFAMSPVDSRYLTDSDDEMLDNASLHSRLSDSKHLRFTIPTASESGSTPSPSNMATTSKTERDTVIQRDYNTPSTSFGSAMGFSVIENPTRTELDDDESKLKRTLKDSVRGRRSHSTSLNSSLGDNPNLSIESIADIPITLINPRYSSEKRRSLTPNKEQNAMNVDVEVKVTPQARRPLRTGDSTSLHSRSRSVTPERMDSPVATPIALRRRNRSRSRTPEVSPRSSPLESISEQPLEDYPSPPASTLRVPKAGRSGGSRSRTPERRVLESPRLEAIVESPVKHDFVVESPQRSQRSRSRSKTPERIEKKVLESPVLEAIVESPAKPEEVALSPKRSLRSRSRTPEVEVLQQNQPETSRNLRSRSKTPDKFKIFSPIDKPSVAKAKRSLTRMVLEHNTFSKKGLTDKTSEESEQNLPSTLGESTVKSDHAVIECTPLKNPTAKANQLLDAMFSPIMDQSVLETPNASGESSDSFTEKDNKQNEAPFDYNKTIPPLAFTLSESYFEKSVLQSYESSVAEDSDASIEIKKKAEVIASVSKREVSISPLGDFSMDCRSVLKDASSLITSDSDFDMKDESKGEVNVEIQEKLAKMISEVINAPVVQTSEHTDPLSVDQESMQSDAFAKKGIDFAESSTNVKSESQESEDLKALETKTSNIQKEKQAIVEIEREIHEIEVDISDDESASGNDDESGDGDESGVSDASTDEVGSDEDVSERESGGEDDDEEEDDSANDDDDVINIVDSSDDSHNLEIDESISNPPIEEDPQLVTAEEEKPKTDVSEVDVKENEPSQQLPKAEIPLAQDSLIEAEQDIGKIQEIEKEGQLLTQETIESQAKPLGTEILCTASISLLTDDNSVLESDNSDINLNYSDEKCDKEALIDAPKIELTIAVKPIDTEMTDVNETEPINLGLDVVDAGTDAINIPETKEKAVQEVVIKEGEAIKTVEESVAPDAEMAEIKDTKTEEKPVKAKSPARKRSGSVSSTKSNTESTSENSEKKSEKSEPKASEDKAQSKRRGKGKTPEIEQQKLDESQSGLNISTQSKPVTRKRSQSTTSNKSETDIKTPEKVETPTRSRAKTPINTEVRRILTRRASKELSESRILEDSVMSESDLTPKKRATRSRSQSIDDNASKTSEATRSKASAVSEEGDVKVMKKGRKSVVAAKPDLSVIPEVSTDEAFGSKLDDNSQIVKEYSTSRRLTRHQKSLLESWLDVKQSPQVARPTSSKADSIEDDTSSLTRGDYEGSVDSEGREQRESPESMSSSASRPAASRLKRAASEAKVSTPRVASRLRKGSVDVLAGSSIDPSVDSPSRSRRSSFNKACEALLTPKGKRGDTPVKEGESVAHSPAVTPARRARRVSSTQSNASGKSTNTTKRSKKE